MAMDDRARLRQAGFSEDEIDAYLAKQKPTPQIAVAADQSAAPTQRIRTFAQGATLGLADEAEAAVRSLLPGQTYESAIQDVRGKLAAYRGDRPLEAMGAEVLGGLATGVAGGARALAATAGRTGLREALKAGARTAATSSIGQGVIGGAAGAEGGVENRLRGAAVGGTIAAALPFGVSRLAGLPGVRQVAEGAGQLYGAAQRGVANVLEGTPLQRLGRAIEPTDVTRVQREAATELPGGVAGPTVATMEGGTSAARTAKTQATIAAEQGKLSAQQAAAARRKAEEEARAAIGQVQQEESALGALAKQRAGAVKAQGKSRAERLSEVAKTAETEAKAIQRGAAAEVRQVSTATREQAKLAAQEALEEARGEAAAVVGGLRGRQPRGAAKKLQEDVRGKQLAEGEESYRLIREVGPPPTPDMALHTEILNDPQLRKLYDDVNRELMVEARKAAPGEGPIFQSLRIGDEDVNEITLEAMDRLRRRLVEPQYRKDPNVVGLSASQKKAILDRANDLEERFLAGYGDDVAADALRNAREPYREKFVRLAGIADGLGLGSAKAGRPSGILAQSRKELDEVAERVGKMTDDQREAFQVGAREWFDRVIQESPSDALAIAKKFNTEASQRRLALAYGDEAVESLRAFAPDIVGKRQAAAAARVRQEGEELARQITGRAEAAATPLQSRAERAAALAERAQAQKGLRSEQILGQRQADAARRLMETQRTTGAQVSAARAQATAAQEEAGRLAQELAQARVTAAQAKEIPFGDLGRALGTSTQQQTFLQRLLPQMNEAQRTQAVEVLGSNIQRELQDMARSGKSMEEIQQRIRVLEQNDVVRTLLAPQMQAFVRNLTPSIGTRVPQVFRPAVSGVLGRMIGANFNE